MRKLISILALLLLIAAPAMAAQDMPLMAQGTFESAYPAGQHVTITNLRTLESVTVTSTAVDSNHGWFGFEWGNTESGYQTGDTFTAVLGGISRSATYDGRILNLIEFGAVELSSPQQPPVIIPPVEPEVPPVTPGECPACPTCPDAPVCPATPPFDAALAAALLGAGAVVTGVGVRIYKGTAGAVTQHKHYGVTSYHSIYTVHSNVLIRHPKGEVQPEYKNGRYVPK